MSIGAFGENFPYVNFHDLNLDWIIKTLKELNDKFDDAIASKITVADPIQWDISKQYEAYTIVMDNDNAYLSIKPVPYGIPISDTEYWQEVFNLSDVFDSLKDAVSFSDDGDSTTSSANRSVNDLVWLNNVLYKVINSISLGDTYSSSNVEEVSVELWVKSLLNSAVSSLTDDLDTAVTRLETAITTGDTNTLNQYKRNRKSVIFIGDSYGIDYETYWQGWQHCFNTLYGDNVTIFQSAVGGSAFKKGDSTPNYYEQLVTLLATMTDAQKASITDVVALGGYNDVSFSTTENELVTLLTQFKNTALASCPYAKISIGFIGVRYGNKAKMDSLGAMNDIYKSAGQKSGITFIENMFWILLNKSLIFIEQDNPSSYFHPNTAGNTEIAKKLYQYLTTGNIGEVEYAERIWSNDVNVYVKNGIVTIFPTMNPYISTSGVTIASGSWVNINSLADSNLLWFFGEPTNNITPTADCFIMYSGHNADQTPAKKVQARFYNGYFQIGNQLSLDAITGSSSWFICVPTFTLPWNVVYL